MFAVEERDSVRERLLEFAEADQTVTAAAITGSYADGRHDRWSDIDLAFAVRGGLDATLERWTDRLYEDFAAVHHWDLPSGSTVYRVFLLPGWLEVDIAFSPEEDFGPRGPSWRRVFGQANQLVPSSAPTHGQLAGLAWHHALHARVCIERHRWWQAEYWISAARDQVLTLACLRAGYPTSYAKGAHLLPAQLTASLEAALVQSLDEPELCRALGVVLTALATELTHTAPLLATQLEPMLADLAQPDRDDT